MRGPFDTRTFHNLLPRECTQNILSLVPKMLTAALFTVQIILEALCGEGSSLTHSAWGVDRLWEWLMLFVATAFDKSNACKRSRPHRRETRRQRMETNFLQVWMAAGLQRSSLRSLLCHCSLNFIVRPKAKTFYHLGLDSSFDDSESRRCGIDSHRCLCPALECHHRWWGRK